MTDATQKKTALVDIPAEVIDYFRDSNSVLKVLSNAAADTTVEVQPEKHRLVITSSLGSSLEAVEKLAKELVELVRSQVVPLYKQLSEAKNQKRPQIAYEEFAVPYSLMSLVIGPRGTNINAARDMPGVLGVDNSPKFVATKGIQLFKVIAKDAETAKKARSLIEYVKVAVPVHHAYVGKIIGKGGAVIQDIVDKSEVQRVNIDPESKNPGPNAEINFHFTGLRSSVEMAKSMVNLQVQIQRDIEKLRNEMHTIQMETKRQFRPKQVASEEKTSKVVSTEKSEKTASAEQTEKTTSADSTAEKTDADGVSEKAGKKQQKGKKAAAAKEKKAAAAK